MGYFHTDSFIGGKISSEDEPLNFMAITPVWLCSSPISGTLQNDEMRISKKIIKREPQTVHKVTSLHGIELPQMIMHSLAVIWELHSKSLQLKQL